MQKIIDVIITDIDKLGLPFLLIQKQRVLPDTFAVGKDFVRFFKNGVLLCKIPIDAPVKPGGSSKRYSYFANGICIFWYKKTEQKPCKNK